MHAVQPRAMLAIELQTQADFHFDANAHTTISFETDFEALKMSFYDLRSIHLDWEILRMQPTGSY